MVRVAAPRSACRVDDEDDLSLDDGDELVREANTAASSSSSEPDGDEPWPSARPLELQALVAGLVAERAARCERPNDAARVPGWRIALADEARRRRRELVARAIFRRRGSASLNADAASSAYRRRHFELALEASI